MKMPQKTLEPLGIKKLSNKELVTVARKGKHFTYFPKITKEAYTQPYGNMVFHTAVFKMDRGIRRPDCKD